MKRVTLAGADGRPPSSETDRVRRVEFNLPLAHGVTTTSAFVPKEMLEAAMGIAITFRHLGSSDAVKAYVHDKVERVQKYLRQPLDAHVTLFLERHQHVAEISLHTSGRHYQAQADSDDMYKSIDLMIDKVEHQISKHHDSVARNKKGAEAARAVAVRAVMRVDESGSGGE